MTEYKKTIFLDIDGCILKHQGGLTNTLLNEPELLPDVKEKFDLWESKGYTIILTTGRKESMRKFTEDQIRSFGLFFTQLIMECGRGQRVVINDQKPDIKEPTARGICIPRNIGLSDVEI